MKRISLILSVLMILSFGLASAQQVTVDVTSGFFAPNNIGVGMPVTIQVSFNHSFSPNAWGGYSIANDFYSPNGATWTPSTQAYSGAGVSVLQAGFGAGNTSLSTRSLDGALNDTVFVGGFDNQAPFNDVVNVNGVVLQVNIGSFPVADTGKTFCIDSCTNYPPTNDWSFGQDDGITTVSPGYGTGPQAANYTAGQGYCFRLFQVPNLAPVFSNCPPSVSGSFCNIMSFDLDATDSDGPAPITYSVTAGVGSVNSSTGLWSYQPTCADVGQNISATVRATDALGAFSDCTFNVIATNVGPTITSGCGANVEVGRGLSASTDLNATAPEACDVLTWSIGNVSPAPVGTVSVDANGNVTFATNVADGGTTFTIDVVVTDCAGAADTCQVTFEVLILTPYEICISQNDQQINPAYQGQHYLVDVTLNAGSQPMGGFDILIAYDASALNFVEAIEGPDFYVPGCGWEYFTYRFSPFGNCGNACASGKLRVVGIAETNNGPNHPDCFLPPTLPAVMFTLDFLITDDRTFECQFIPIYFCWFDCGDNTISTQAGDTLYISRDVYSQSGVQIDALGQGYPTFAGAQEDCENPIPGKPDPIRFIDFCNGGIWIACADSIDARGDLNLNEIGYEIADAVLYSNYFVFGPSVFDINPQGQIAASDVNADGIALSVADLVYLIRVVIGDANPYPKFAPASVEATYNVANGEVSIDAPVAAAAIVVEGNVKPTLIADNMDMRTEFDGTNTRILVYTDVNRGSVETFNGTFITNAGNVISAEFATAEGGVVAAKGTAVPKAFSLNQNKPNPFNPKTRISFSLPSASAYTLTIYNVAGQKVTEFAGTAKTGGVHEVEWNASTEASGIYFYKLTAGNFSDTKKMVFLK